MVRSQRPETLVKCYYCTDGKGFRSNSVLPTEHLEDWIILLAAKEWQIKHNMMPHDASQSFDKVETDERSK